MESCNNNSQINSCGLLFETSFSVGDTGAKRIRLSHCEAQSLSSCPHPVHIKNIMLGFSGHFAKMAPVKHTLFELSSGSQTWLVETCSTKSDDSRSYKNHLCGVFPWFLPLRPPFFMGTSQLLHLVVEAKWTRWLTPPVIKSVRTGEAKHHKHGRWTWSLSLCYWWQTTAVFWQWKTVPTMINCSPFYHCSSPFYQAWVGLELFNWRFMAPGFPH